MRFWSVRLGKFSINFQVEKSADAWDDGGRTSLEADNMQLRPLIGTVTSFDGDCGYISQTTSFTRYSLSEGSGINFHSIKLLSSQSLDI